MIDLREAKKEDLELLYSMQLKAFAALYEKYQDYLVAMYNLIVRA